MASRTRAIVVGLVHAGACLLASPAVGATDSQAGATPAASATPEDKALARKLGEQGFLLFDAGDYANAAERFERALELYDAVTLRVARGRALERLGRLVAAAEEFRRAESQSPSANEPASFAAARVSARQALQEVSPRIAHLTVQLVNPRGQLPKDWSLRVGGQDWLQASVGVSRPFDPGQYVIVVTLRDGQTVERSVVLGEGAHVTATLELPAPSQSAESPAVEFETAPKPIRESSPSNTPLLVATITTAVLTAGAIATGIVAWSKRDHYDEQNRDDAVEDSTKESLRKNAELWSWVNTGLVVGAIGGAGFTVYYWLDSSDADTASKSALGSAALGSAAMGAPAHRVWGLQWSGTF